MTAMPDDERLARAIADRAPAIMRELSRELLADMDRVDPGRPRLAPDLEAEVELVVSSASATSWRSAILRAACELLDLDPLEGPDHPAVSRAEEMLTTPSRVGHTAPR
jgi:hypothetical protein